MVLRKRSRPQDGLSKDAWFGMATQSRCYFTLCSSRLEQNPSLCILRCLLSETWHAQEALQSSFSGFNPWSHCLPGPAWRTSRQRRTQRPTPSWKPWSRQRKVEASGSGGEQSSTLAKVPLRDLKGSSTRQGSPETGSRSARSARSARLPKRRWKS